jgi:two-component system, LytTR family, response regulator
MNNNIIPIGSRKKVPSKDILYLQSDLNYTKVFLVNGQMIFSSTTLKIIESRLAENPEFLRINRGTVINRQHVKAYQEDSLELNNNLHFVVSRRRKGFLNVI